MEIESTPLYREAMKIMTNGQTSAHSYWKCLIHYGNNKTFAPLVTEAVCYVREYRKAFSDVMTVSVKMGLGDYARRIYPNRVGLQITLTKQATRESGGNIDPNQKPESERYTAVLLDGPTAPTVGQGAESNDIEALNISQIVDVHFQVMQKPIEQLKTMLVGTVYRGSMVGDVLRSVLTTTCANLKLPEDVSIKGVNIAPPNNTNVKGNLVIPHGTRAVDVPDFIQNRYGVYNAGIGTYIQNRIWYVYSLFNTARFSTEKQTLTILVLPKRKFANIERTFMKNGDSVIVLATSETSFKDDSGTQYINTGNGVRFANATNLIDVGFTTGGNKMVASRGANANEFVAEKTEVNYAPVSNRRITSNPFVEFSRLASKKGGTFRCTWQNSDPTLITPAMSARIVFSDGSSIKTVYGVVQIVEHVAQLANGFASDQFINNTVVSVFVNNQVVPFEDTDT